MPFSSKEEMTLDERQRRLIYAILVAGKSAKFVNSVMERFALMQCLDELPFDTLRRWKKGDQLTLAAERMRCGNYKKTVKAWAQIVEEIDSLDLLTCTPQRLEEIHGIGPKTSRFSSSGHAPGRPMPPLTSISFAGSPPRDTRTSRKAPQERLTTLV